MAEQAMQESPVRALLVALSVALVCALVVSVAAVQLRPFYLANLEAERLARLDAILVSLRDSGGDIDFQDLEARVVDLNTGDYLDNLNPATHDARKLARDPATSTAGSAEHDLAGIKRRENPSVVYLLRGSDDSINAVILPVWGVGYQSAMYGYLALEGGLDRILAFKVYEQGETAGLGSRVQDPEWEALWPGKPAFDQSGRVVVHVGKQPDGDRTARVDGISGATRTSLGVNGMVRFWLGEYGFGPYLDRIRQGEG